MHIALQRTRTQAARDAGQPFSDKLAQLMFEQAVGNNEELNEAEKKGLLDIVSAIEADPVQAQGIQMGVAVQHASALSDLTPIVLENKTNRPFLFGDAPVVFYNARYREVKLRGVLGMATPGLMVLMPLCSKTCLLLLDENEYSVKGFIRNNMVAVRQLSDVVTLNKLQLHAAAECLYAPSNPILTADSSQARHSAGAGLPAVRQQFLNSTGPLCWQSREDILQVGIRIMPIHAG